MNLRRHRIQPHICARRLVALRFNVPFYSYPRDIETVKVRSEHIRASRAEIAADLAGLGFDLHAEASLVPIFAHRYVVCTSDFNSSVGSVTRRQLYGCESVWKLAEGILGKGISQRLNLMVVGQFL